MALVNLASVFWAIIVSSIFCCLLAGRVLYMCNTLASVNVSSIKGTVISCLGAVSYSVTVTISPPVLFIAFLIFSLTEMSLFWPVMVNKFLLVKL